MARSSTTPRLMVAALASVLLLGGCDSGGSAATGDTISADDLALVSVTSAVEDGTPTYQVTIRNESGRTLSVNGTISAVADGRVLASGTFTAVDLRDDQQTTVPSRLFDLTSFAGVQCYQYSLTAYSTIAPAGSDTESYPGTCG